MGMAIIPTCAEPERKIHWTESHLQSRLNIACYAHQAAGFEDAASFVLDRASKAFVIHQDEIATTLREVARELALKGSELRAAQKAAQKAHNQSFNDAATEN